MQKTPVFLLLLLGACAQDYKINAKPDENAGFDEEEENPEDVGEDTAEPTTETEK